MQRSMMRCINKNIVFSAKKCISVLVLIVVQIPSARLYAKKGLSNPNKILKTAQVSLNEFLRERRASSPEQNPSVFKHDIRTASGGFYVKKDDFDARGEKIGETAIYCKHNWRRQPVVYEVLKAKDANGSLTSVTEKGIERLRESEANEPDRALVIPRKRLPEGGIHTNQKITRV